MTSFEHTVVITRPVEDVWAYLMDAGNDPVWQSPIVEVRRGAGEQPTVGTQIEEVAHFLGRKFSITLEITELEPPVRSAVRTSSGPVQLTGTYELAPVPGGTLFTMRGSVEGHGFFRVADSAFARAARRHWESSAETLKDVLEADVSAGRP